MLVRASGTRCACDTAGSRSWAYPSQAALPGAGRPGLYRRIRLGLSRYERHERVPGPGRVLVVPGTRVPRGPGPHPSVRPWPYLPATAVAHGGPVGGSGARGGAQLARVGRDDGDGGGVEGGVID